MEISEIFMKVKIYKVYRGCFKTWSEYIHYKIVSSLTWLRASKCKLPVNLCTGEPIGQSWVMTRRLFQSRDWSGAHDPCCFCQVWRQPTSFVCNPQSAALRCIRSLSTDPAGPTRSWTGNRNPLDCGCRRWPLGSPRLRFGTPLPPLSALGRWSTQ